jgi:hypothetical protein
VAIDGGTMVGCVSVGGRLGIARPGRRRQIHRGPEGASGTEAGGTGGGRSENIWAETGPKGAAAPAGKRKRREKPPRAPARIRRCRYPRSHGHAFH